MKKQKINEIIEKAKNLSKENGNWHFHMLGENCIFNNNNKGKFSIVFEDEKNGEIYFSLFDDKPLKDAKVLADLMYGGDFLGKQEKDFHNPEFNLILARVKELVL